MWTWKIREFHQDLALWAMLIPLVILVFFCLQIISKLKWGPRSMTQRHRTQMIFKCIHSSKTHTPNSHEKWLNCSQTIEKSMTAFFVGFVLEKKNIKQTYIHTDWKRWEINSTSVRYDRMYTCNAIKSFYFLWKFFECFFSFYFVIERNLQLTVIKS